MPPKDFTPFFSVVIPTYNRLNQTNLALRSVLKQIAPCNFKGLFFDCWIIDDGSKSAYFLSSALEKEFTQKKIPLYLKRIKKNQGVSKARNWGIKLSKGQWVAFLDSDDEWKENKLQEQFYYLKKNSHYLIIQSEEIWIRNGNQVIPPQSHRKTKGFLFKRSLERCLITPSSVIIKRELFYDNYFFDEKLPACEDYDLWLRITLKQAVGLVPKKLLIRYGGHADQLSTKYPLMDKFRLKSLIKVKKLARKEKKFVEEKWIDEIFFKKINIILQGARKRKKIFHYFYFSFLKKIYRFL